MKGREKTVGDGTNNSDGAAWAAFTLLVLLLVLGLLYFGGAFVGGGRNNPGLIISSNAVSSRSLDRTHGIHTDLITNTQRLFPKTQSR